MKFDISRHNDPTYTPPAPWDEWDEDCWVCNKCGAAAGFQVHGPLCKHGETFWKALKVTP